MSNPFFDHPILNSPYAYPDRHWELDDQGQPTQQIINRRRRVSFITPIPKPKKQKRHAAQTELALEDGSNISNQTQKYDIQAIINDVRQEVDVWRTLPPLQQVHQRPDRPSTPSR